MVQLCKFGDDVTKEDLIFMEESRFLSKDIVSQVKDILNVIEPWPSEEEPRDHDEALIKPIHMLSMVDEANVNRVWC